MLILIICGILFIILPAIAVMTLIIVVFLKAFDTSDKHIPTPEQIAEREYREAHRHDPIPITSDRVYFNDVTTACFHCKSVVQFGDKYCKNCGVKLIWKDIPRLKELIAEAERGEYLPRIQREIEEANERARNRPKVPDYARVQVYPDEGEEQVLIPRWKKKKMEEEALWADDPPIDYNSRHYLPHSNPPQEPDLLDDLIDIYLYDSLM